VVHGKEGVVFTHVYASLESPKEKDACRATQAGKVSSRGKGLTRGGMSCERRLRSRRGSTRKKKTQRREYIKEVRVCSAKRKKV